MTPTPFFERLFADPTKPLDDPTQPQGISAVKAIAIAAAIGQKVYTLNAQNQAYHSGIVAGLGTDADTKAEISNALNAGMEVTVHQTDITAHGWTGSGYIILDPETGAGAYKISGGANGGGLILLFTGMALVLIAVLAGPFGLEAAAATGLLYPFITKLALLAAAGVALMAAGVAALAGDKDSCANYLGAATGLLAGVIFGPFGEGLAGILGALVGIGTGLNAYLICG